MPPQQLVIILMQANCHWGAGLQTVPLMQQKIIPLKRKQRTKTRGNSLHLAFLLLFQRWLLIKAGRIVWAAQNAILGAHNSSGGSVVTFASLYWASWVVKWIDDCRLLWKYTMLNKCYELLLFNILRRWTCLQTARSLRDGLCLETFRSFLFYTEDEIF